MEFVPVIYEHAAALIGRTPWEVSRSSDLLAAAHSAAYQIYHHSPLVAGIDIYNVEAEAYGAVIAEPEGSAIPSITAHPCTHVREVCALRHPDPDRDGRLRDILAAATVLKRTFPDVEVRVPISGPFSIAGNLTGLTALLEDTLDGPSLVGMALDHIVEGQLRFCQRIAEARLGCILFESAATPPLLSPQAFRELVLPRLRRLIRGASVLTGHSAPCIIGGNTAPIADALMETGTTYVICPSETDQAKFMEALRAYPLCTVRINMNPAVFLPGEWVRVEREVLRVASVVRDRPHTCIGTGVLPFDTDPALVTRARQFVDTL